MSDVSLRLMTEIDWPLFKALHTSPEVMKEIYQACSVEQARKLFERRVGHIELVEQQWLSYTIINQHQAALGFIGLKYICDLTKRAEVGYLVATSAQGQGIATKALTQMVELAFGRHQLNKISAFCSVNNIGSSKLLEKLNFNREGRLAQNSLLQDKLVDDFIYGLLK